MHKHLSFLVMGNSGQNVDEALGDRFPISILHRPCDTSHNWQIYSASVIPRPPINLWSRVRDCMLGAATAGRPASPWRPASVWPRSEPDAASTSWTPSCSCCSFTGGVELIPPHKGRSLHPQFGHCSWQAIHTAQTGCWWKVMWVVCGGGVRSWVKSCIIWAREKHRTWSELRPRAIFRQNSLLP